VTVAGKKLLTSHQIQAQQQAQRVREIANRRAPGGRLVRCDGTPEELEVYLRGEHTVGWNVRSKVRVGDLLVSCVGGGRSRMIVSLCRVEGVGKDGRAEWEPATDAPIRPAVFGTNLVSRDTHLGGPAWEVADGQLAEAFLDALAFEVANQTNVPEVEGAKQSRECRIRSRVLRAKALEQAGGQCDGCKRNLRDLFGFSRGDRGLEMHHLKPMSESPGGPILTDLKSVVILCATCHRLLHADPEKNPDCASSSYRPTGCVQRVDEVTALQMLGASGCARSGGNTAQLSLPNLKVALGGAPNVARRCLESPHRSTSHTCSRTATGHPKQPQRVRTDGALQHLHDVVQVVGVVTPVLVSQVVADLGERGGNPRCRSEPCASTPAISIRSHATRRGIRSTGSDSRRCRSASPKPRNGRRAKFRSRNLRWAESRHPASCTAYRVSVCRLRRSSYLGRRRLVPVQPLHGLDDQEKPRPRVLRDGDGAAFGGLVRGRVAPVVTSRSIRHR